MADNQTESAAVATVNQEWNPNNEEFVQEVVIAGIVLFAVGVAVLAAFLIYYIVRCVCWTCLGDECCDKRNKMRATQSMVTWNNRVITLMLLACIAGGAWLLYAGSPIISSLDSLTITMVKEAERFKDSANTSITAVEAAVGNGTTVDLTELKKAKNLLADAQADLERAEDSTRNATDSFGGVIIFIGVCAIVCAILGLLCVFVRSIIFLYLYFILATFTVFALWSLAGFGIVGNRAFEETCTMMDLHARGQKNQYVIDNLPCDQLAQAGDAIEETQLGANKAVEDGNAQLSQLNSALVPIARGLEPVLLLCQPYVRQDGKPEAPLVPNPSNSTSCVKLTKEEVKKEYGPLVCPNSAVTEISPSNRAWLACAFANPSTPMPNSTYTELVVKAQQLQVLNSQLGTIREITECGFVDSAFKTVVAGECPGLTGDSYRLVSAALISAITLTITSFYFCICIQNIRKQDAPQPAAGEEKFAEGKAP